MEFPWRSPAAKRCGPPPTACARPCFPAWAAGWSGASFLDLFAGSGAYGLEALSRGAAGGVFVEREARAIACLRRNLAAVCKSLGRDQRGLVVLPTDASTAPDGGAGVLPT